MFTPRWYICASLQGTWFYEFKNTIIRGGPKGGGAWGPMPPPSRRSKCGRFTARLEYVATPTQRTSPYESLLHVLQNKHLNLHLPRDSSLPSVPQIQKLILNKRDSEKRPYDELPELHVLQLSPKASEFSWGSMPPDPLHHSALYAHRQLRATCTTPNPTLYVCPPPPPPSSSISRSAPGNGLSENDMQQIVA